MRRTARLFALSVCAVVCLSIAANAFADTVYVATTGSDLNDGSSAHPFRTITHAMAVVNRVAGPALVIVSHGTYNSSGGEAFPLTVPSNLLLYGEMGAKETVIDASGATPRAGVIRCIGNNSSSGVIGFTITGGLVLVQYPSAARGGGIFTDSDDQSRIRDNIITGNEVRGYPGSQNPSGVGGQALGGGIYQNATSSLPSPEIVNNIITQNIARGGAGASKVSGNAGNGGGAFGGGLYVNNGTPNIRNNTVVANLAVAGDGGVAAAGIGGAGGAAFGGGILGQTLSSNERGRNNIVSDNQAIGGAGGSGSTSNGLSGTAVAGAGLVTLTTEDHNIAYNNVPDDGAYNASDITGVDPQFMSTLQPRFSSPARGAGVQTDTNDMLYRLRNAVGGAPGSIGAYELLSRADSNWDRKSDIVWRNQANGASAIWLMNGASIGSSQALPTIADPNWQIQGIVDVDGFGGADILWRNVSTGDNVLWPADPNGGVLGDTAAILPSVPDVNWVIVATGDFNGDGRCDLFWRNVVTGDNVIWFMRTGLLPTDIAPGFVVVLPAVPDLTWSVAGSGDLNGDGNVDVVWWNSTTGNTSAWLLGDAGVLNSGGLAAVANTQWRIAGLGDFQGDGKADIVWHNASTGDSSLWYMNGLSIAFSTALPGVSDTRFDIVKIADFQGDGKADIFWRNRVTGTNAVWLMNDATIAVSASFPTVSDTNWHVSDRP